MPDTNIEIRTTNDVKTPSLWTVTILNDDYTPMEFVIDVLMNIFRKSEKEAEEMTLTVHQKGAAVVGLYTKDIATTKVDRAMRLAEGSQHPLSLRAEAS